MATSMAALFASLYLARIEMPIFGIPLSWVLLMLKALTLCLWSHDTKDEKSKSSSWGFPITHAYHALTDIT